jgi:bacteriocin-like protein
MDEKKITQQLDDSELEEISGGYLFNASVLFEYDVLP